MSKYQIGYNENIIKSMKEKTAVDSARFLLTYLKPEMNLLDCGCGPGGISISLAEILNKGNLIGIDIEQSQIEIAEKIALEKNVKNIQFKLADIFHLPFADNSFDVVFTHATLYHLNSPVKALKEMLRVIKPGGIMAAREPDTQAIMLWPQNDLIEKAQKLRNEFLAASGTDLTMGRKLRSIFIESGFVNVTGYASCDAKGTKESLESVINYLTSELVDTPFGKNLIKENLTNSDEIKELQRAYKSLTYESGAFISFTWGEAIGYKK